MCIIQDRKPCLMVSKTTSPPRSLLLVFLFKKSFKFIKSLCFKLHLPGIEPGAPPWKGSMLPLHHRCYKHKALDDDGIRTHAGVAQ